MKIIDLSKTIYFNKKDPKFMRVKLENYPHKKSSLLIRFFLKLPKALYPKNFEGWADDKIKNMGVHSTTHIDAPWHYAPIINGQRAKSIDEVPLEWLYGDGLVIDMSHKENFELITLHAVQNFLRTNNLEIKPHNIVLIFTGRDKLEGMDIFDKGVGMSGEATEWIIDQGVKVMGIDQWGFDLPLRQQVKLAKATNNAELFWEAHLVGARKEYLHMEQLANLQALPYTGFKVAVFPLKLKNASAAPARVVAIFED